MKLTRNIFTAVLLALALTGCEDFLEPNSKSEFVPKDATSLNELLLGEAYQRNDKDGLSVFMCLLDDDIEATPYQEPNAGFDENKYLASFSWQPDMFKMMENANSGHINIYESYYKLILGVNAVIDYIPIVDDTEEMKNIVKAQAYALRGFYYFNLVNIFGQPYNYNKEALAVPLKLNSGIEADENALKRKTVAEVYAQVLSDLHTAEMCYEALPLAEQWKPKFRTSLPMVQLMLSRTYLYMENWEKAAQYAKMVMDNKNFSLFDLNNVSYDAVEYMYYPAYNSPETIWPYGSQNDMFGWTCEGANTSHYENKTTKMYAYFQASEGLKEAFNECDLRRNRYIITAPNETYGNMEMAYGKIQVGTQYYLPKDAVNVFGRSLRLSEAYLNYAEAEANLDGEGFDNAIETLNTLREKRFDPEDIEYLGEDIEITSKEELITFIKEERRRELCFEGHRWFDLRRWGMPEIKHTWHTNDGNKGYKTFEYTLNEKDLMYTIPIPDEAIQENNRLEQNELPGKREGIELK